ncbi:MaoC family dehydratase [Nocardioides endophyticus]|uniref:MaoC family dehydratase n=1 Tax=Nocardioides endophyticus TaxID=1353775 RepID=A0ABP8Z1A7_9ACTN
MTRPVAVGDELPALKRTPGFAEWNRFAAVNCEFVPIHMDDEEGRRAGYPRAIGMGRLQWSYVHTMLRGWIGDTGRIVALSLEFRRPSLRDEPLAVRGRVLAVRGDGERQEVDLEVWVEDAGGAVLAPGSATVELH